MEKLDFSAIEERLKTQGIEMTVDEVADAMVKDPKAWAAMFIMMKGLMDVAQHTLGQAILTFGPVSENPN